MYMKKFTAILLCSVFIISLAACGSREENEENNKRKDREEALSDDTLENTEKERVSSGENILIAYFSWADNAVLDEDVDAVASPSVTAPGNVQQLAGWVQEETGGTLFLIQVTEPYPSDWDQCLERANQERGQDARPELAESVENMEDYDVVFLGYPNWWYGVPMALLSFLENHDLAGKQVYLFCSHGTGGLSNSVDIISEAIPNATISDNIFDCYEEEASSSQADIQSWVTELGYARTAAPESIERTEGTQLSVTWGDVVMFYGDYNENPSLFELGQIVSGEELVSQMSGTITIAAAN